MPTTPPTPTHYEVIEFYGTGDPYFGGRADDRPLCIDGQFSRMYVQHLTAHFASESEAQRAAAKADKRTGGRIGIIRCYAPERV